MIEASQKHFAIVETEVSPWQLQDKLDTTKDAYRYTPLPSKGDHFRLIELLPGKFHSPILIKIDTYELDSSIDTPDYYALSYTWNDTEHDSLIINGRYIAPSDRLRTTYDIRHIVWCGSKQVLISTTLRDALRRLRSVSDTMHLWIDQLCINQYDMDERATQVVTMQRIYHQARGVRIWLGEHRHDSSLGIKIALQLHQLRADCHSGSRQYPKRNEIYAAHTLGLPDFRTSPEWFAFMQLLTRPVFRRIWIVQEIVAAVNAQVLCGDSAMFDHQIFIDALDFLDKTGWIHDLDRNYGEGQNHASFFRAVLNIKLLWMQNPTFDLRKKQRQYMLQAIRRFQATDPRDKVYALLPIINDYGHRDLHGCDAPLEYQSSRDQKRRKGPLDRMMNDMMKLEDEADTINIMNRSSETLVRNLRATLISFLWTVPELLQPFLRPSHTNDLKLLHEALAFDFIKLAQSLHDFQVRRSSTKEHKRISMFLANFHKDALSRLQTFYDLLPLTKYEMMMMLKMGDPTYAPDIEELQKRVNQILARLDKGPSNEPSSNRSEKVSVRELMQQGKIIVGEPAGVRPSQDHQFHDWAWSARGSTVADYRKWTTAVYTEFTVKCIQDDGNLDILTNVEDPGERKQYGLPSWAPDFSVITSRNPLKAIVHEGAKEVVNYDASKEAIVEVGWDSDNPGLLRLEGREIIQIAWLASTESATASAMDINHILTWEARIKQLHEVYPTEEDTFDAYWRTLIGDVVTQDGLPVFPAPAHYRTHYRAFVAILELEAAAKRGGKDGIDSYISRQGWREQDIPLLMQGYNKFSEEMAGIMLQRRLCVLGDDLIGAVPISAQIDDWIYMLKGGKVLYVLRDVGYGWYKLIGECYIHGIMRGEESCDGDWTVLQLV